MKIENNNYGIGFLGLLAIAFIVLKLLGIINWSWWWVLAPIYLPLALLIFGILLAVFIAFISDRLKN